MIIVRTALSRHRSLSVLIATAAVLATTVLAGSATAAQPAPHLTTRATANALAADCSVGQSGAAIPTASSGQAAVRTTIGVAKSMGISVKGQIVAVMVMFQESTIRNLANDGTSTLNASWPVPGRDYWMNVTRLSLKYPHDKFGLRDGAHDADSIGLYQQRPAYGWGNYGTSTGTTDPEGVVQRLLDPRWEAMAFFGGVKSAAPTSGLLDVPGWENMAPTAAANAVQQSNYPDLYAQWEGPATTYVNNNQDAPAITLPWYPGGGAGALGCTSIPTDPAAGEAGHNPFGSLDIAVLDGTGIRVTGWMLDPDAANGLGVVHFYDQGPFGTSGYPTGIANQPRPDVNRAFNVLGNFGFTARAAVDRARPPHDLRLRDQRRTGDRQSTNRLPGHHRARPDRLVRLDRQHQQRPDPALRLGRRPRLARGQGGGAHLRDRNQRDARHRRHDDRGLAARRRCRPRLDGLEPGVSRHGAEHGRRRQPGLCVRDQRQAARHQSVARLPDHHRSPAADRCLRFDLRHRRLCPSQRLDAGPQFAGRVDSGAHLRDLVEQPGRRLCLSRR